MSMLAELPFDGTGVAPEEWGGKAFGIVELSRFGFQIPSTLLLRCVESMDSFLGDKRTRERVEQFANRFQSGDSYQLAIRSSSPNEDGHRNSSAGLYRSEVGKLRTSDLWPMIDRVLISGSGEAPRGRMGVVIQEAIEGEISGVCFSSHPLTAREPLINVFRDARLADAER